MMIGHKDAHSAVNSVSRESHSEIFVLFHLHSFQVLSSLSASEIVGAVFPRLLRELTGWQLLCLQAACANLPSSVSGNTAEPRSESPSPPRQKLTGAVTLLSQILDQCRQEIREVVYCQPVAVDEKDSALLQVLAN